MLRKKVVASSGSDRAAGPSPVATSDLGEGPGQVGIFLLRQGLIGQEQLDQALAHRRDTGHILEHCLIELGIVPAATLYNALSEFYGVQIVDLRQVVPEQSALELLPDTVARETLSIPLRVDAGVVFLAAAEPTPELRQRLTSVLGKEARLLLAPADDVRRAIDSHYRVSASVDRLVQVFSAVEGQRQRPADAFGAEAQAEDAPVVQVVNLILAQALRDRASDVHLEPQGPVLRVRFRVDGALCDAMELPASMGPGLISRIKIMAGMNIVERRRSQDGQLTAEVDGKGIDVRVATVATILGEKCVLRILDKTRSVFKLAELGMTPDTHELYSAMVGAPFGTILCAGPTGSGKTTTLYATMSELNESSRNIMTIEDPVEYIFPQINQIQTNEQAGITFATGLRSILRQDPDVILVGEIRDVETARIAVQSALTGHLVLSSLHATDSVSALHRFLDMGIESFLIASAVVGIVGQRLVRRICSSCVEQYIPTAEEMAFYHDTDGPAKEVFYRGGGCNFCAGTGFQDRIGVYELLRITPEIKRLIVGWATIDELRRLAQNQGMRTLRQEGIGLVNRNMTTIAEVIRSIYAL